MEIADGPRRYCGWFRSSCLGENTRGDYHLPYPGKGNVSLAPFPPNQNRGDGPMYSMLLATALSAVAVPPPQAPSAKAAPACGKSQCPQVALSVPCAPKAPSAVAVKLTPSRPAIPAVGTTPPPFPAVSIRPPTFATRLTPPRPPVPTGSASPPTPNTPPALPCPPVVSTQPSPTNQVPPRHRPK